MRKLSSASALFCVAVALCAFLPGNPAWADEPPDFSSSSRQPRATPAVLTSRGGDAEALDTLARTTPAAERREDATDVDMPWIIRGTLGTSDRRH